MIRWRSAAIFGLLGVSCGVTLWLLGLTQWVQAVLVIGLELLLGLVLHEWLERPERRTRGRGRPPIRGRDGHAKRPGAKRGRAPAPGGARHPVARAKEPEYAAIGRILVPIRDDRPGLIDFAIRECRARRSGLDVLFLRVLGVVPMGPEDADGEVDAEADRLIEGARRRAELVGVPFRSSYAATHDPAATILDRARRFGVDLVVMADPGRHARGGRLARLLVGDDVREVLDALPDDVGLLVHA